MKKQYTYLELLKRQKKALKILGENLIYYFAEAGTNWQDLTISEQEEEVYRYMQDLAPELLKIIWKIYGEGK